MKRILIVILASLLFIQNGFAYTYGSKSEATALMIDRDLEKKQVSCSWFFITGAALSVWGHYELQRKADRWNQKASVADNNFNQSIEWKDRLYWKARANDLRQKSKGDKALSIALIDVGITLTILSYFSIKRDIKKARERKLQFEVAPDQYKMKLQKRF